ncbi:hypothetical protein HWV62_15917 [Athelia sp. TMB]|nr:hypothetical protein HWV62_15917 [Athelia sp. TMB]
MPRLRVLAGPNPHYLEDITNLVNTQQPHTISTSDFHGQVVANIKDFTGPDGVVRSSDYFEKAERKDITWSLQVQGAFKQPVSADSVLFGNVFDRTYKLPKGSSAALKLMRFLDPNLNYDMSYNGKFWALSPLVSTMPHLSHTRLDSNYQKPLFPPDKPLEDNLDAIHLTHFPPPPPTPPPPTKPASTLSAIAGALRSSISRSPSPEPGFGFRGLHSLNLHDAQERKSYFQTAKHRNEVTFGPEDLLTLDFCYGYLSFNPGLVVRLPGGISVDLMKHWHGQPVNFVCCERSKVELIEGKGPEDPWEKVFWCIQIQPADEDVATK